MAFSCDSKEILKAKTVEQCLDVRQRDKIPPSKGGIKDYLPDGSWLDTQKLESNLAERKQALSEERVKLRSTLSHGIWLPQVGKVKLTTKTGKWWKTFGHSHNGEEFLYPEEALYLVDEGHLLIHHRKIPLSVEETYANLLKSKVSMDMYVVYSHLSHYGYILSRFTKSSSVTPYERLLGLDTFSNSKKERKKLQTRDTKNSEKDDVPEGITLDIDESTSFKNEVDAEENSMTFDKDRSYEEEENMCGVCTHEVKEAWDFTCYDFPNISSCSTRKSKTLTLPIPPQSTLPPGITVTTAYFNIHDYFEKQRIQQATLEYSCGRLRGNRKKALNWQQYHCPDCHVEDPCLSHLWNGRVKPLVHPENAVNPKSLLEKLNVIRSLPQEVSDGLSSTCLDGTIDFNMYKPAKSFPKTQLESTVPMARISVRNVNDSVPDLSSICKMSVESKDGAPVKYAVVDSGNVAFYSFFKVNIDTQMPSEHL